MKQQTGSKSGKEYVKAVYCHPAYLIYCRVHRVKCKAGWSTSGMKNAGRNINNLRYSDDPTLNGKKQRRPIEPLESERGEWKSWLKTQHSENRSWHLVPSFMANRWGNSENSERLYLWAPKSLQVMTAAMKLKDAYSLEEKLWPT